MSETAEDSPKPGKRAGHGHVAQAPHAAHEEAHEGAPEWLISFADNVALMMGFFVILLAMNLGPKGASASSPADAADRPASGPDMLDAVVAIRQAFNHPVDLQNPRPEDAELVRQLLQRGKLLDVLDHAPEGKNREVSSARPSDYHKLAASVSFSSGSSILAPEARRTLAQTAAQIQGMRNIIEIVGHVSAAEADDSPARALRLSYDRAAAVAMELASLGVEWKQMRIIAAADADRLVPRAYGDQQQTRNQRAELQVTDKIYNP